MDIIKTEESCEDDEKDPLIDVVKTENLSEAGEILNGFEIKVEDGMGFWNSNVEQNTEWEELKIEPCEITYADVRPTSSKRTGSTQHSAPARKIDLELKPPKKMKPAELTPPAKKMTLTKGEPSLLIGVSTSDHHPEDGKILNEFKIKVENNLMAGNSNIEEQEDGKELKNEPNEFGYMCVRPTFSEHANSAGYPVLAQNAELELKLLEKTKITEEELGPLIHVLKSENPSEDEGISNQFEIEFESVMEYGNPDIEEQAEWEELKFEPFEITCADAPPSSSELTYSKELSVTKRDSELGLNTPKKITFEEPNQHTVRYPSIKKYGFTQIIKQLVEFCPMSEYKAKTLSKKFLCELLKWVFTVCQQKKLFLYQLRLKVAELSSVMDLAGFTPDDEWFINFKNRLPRDFFTEYQQKPVSYDETSSVLGIDTEHIEKSKSRDELFKQLAIWYHEESPKHIRTPGQLERVAYHIADNMGLESCYLSKDDVLLFVVQQGLYCNINGKVSRLMKVKDGILGLLFEAKLEAWYHEWPKSTDDLLLDVRYLGEKYWSMFKAYLAILSEWLVEGECYFISNTVGSIWQHSLDSSSVDMVENKFHKAVFGPKLYEVHCEFLRVFSAKLKAEIYKIRAFNYKFGMMYCYRPYILCSDHLKKNAEELAFNMGLSDVLITKDWLRRFAELTVACSLTSNKSHNHPKDSNNYFSFCSEEFDVAFEDWYVDGSPSNIVAHSCIAGGSMEPCSQQSIGFKSRFTNKKHRAEVEKWYQKHIVKCFAKSYELKEKSEEIAHLMGLSAFEATKSWMKAFLVRNGIRYYSERDGIIMFPKNRSSLDEDQEFEELFEAWYREGFCTKCAKRLDYTRNSDAGSSKQKEAPPLESLSGLESVARDWYVETSSSCLIAPGDLEKIAMESANKLHIEDFIPSKRWIGGFIGQHGLYCNVNGDRQLLFKSEFEFLRCKFLYEFEMWYHQWPLTLEKSVSKDSVRNLNFELYKEALLNWYLQVSQVRKISVHDIRTKSIAIIKKKMPGIALQDVEVWTKRWCKQCSDVVQKMRGFDSAMRIWYFEKRKSRYITPQELRLEAEERANRKMGFPNFKATDVWLMRFVERYGVYFFSDGVPKFLSSITILMCVNVREFDEVFNAWCAYKPTGGSNESSVVGSNRKSRLARHAEVMSDSDDDHIDHVPLSSVLEAQVASWCRVASKRHQVTPCQYLEKVMEISEDLGLTEYFGLTLGFDYRKNCIKKLVELHGIQVGQQFKHLEFINADCSILKWRFELAFEIWYHAYPLQVDDVKVDEYLPNDDDLTLIKRYVSALHIWYVDARKTRQVVSAEEIRIKEAEIANSLTPSKRKHAMITLWCLKWCLESVAWIKSITSLDSEVASWYRARKLLVKPLHLKEQAEKTARNLDIKEFSVTETWLRRFVHLHGLLFTYEGEVREFPGFADESVKPNCGYLPSFRRYFEEWLDTDNT